MTEGVAPPSGPKPISVEEVPPIPHSPFPISDASAADILGPEGPFAREVPGFATRTSQQTMAAAVEEAIADRQMLIAEAGTGTARPTRTSCRP